MNPELEDLLALLRSKDAFKKKWDYDPFDNYAWREILTFDFLRKWYPTMEKVPGRYGADGRCPELGLHHIEDKSTKIKKRKRTNDYKIESTKYQFDLSKKLDKIMDADAFTFSLFDSYESGYPIHVLFVHKQENVQVIKQLCIEKKKQFDALSEDKRGHAHIDLVYSDIQHLGDKFGITSNNNIMEFML